MTLKIAVFTRSGAMRGLRPRKTRFAPTRPPESGRIRAILTRKGEPYGEFQFTRIGYLRQFTEQTNYDRLTLVLNSNIPSEDRARLGAEGVTLTPEAAVVLALEVAFA